jgi:hypothetical protein
VPLVRLDDVKVVPPRLRTLGNGDGYEESHRPASNPGMCPPEANIGVAPG